MRARLSLQTRTGEGHQPAASPVARLSLFVGSAAGDNLDGRRSTLRKSICEPIFEEPSPLAESSDLAARDPEIYKRTHRPRPPLPRTQSAPLLISTSTTKPFHINPSRSVTVPLTSSSRTHLAAAPSWTPSCREATRLASAARARWTSRPPPPASQPKPCATRSPASSRPSATPPPERYDASTRPPLTALTSIAGIRHRDAVLLLPLYALPRKACQRPGDVRPHVCVCAPY